MIALDQTVNKPEFARTSKSLPNIARAAHDAANPYTMISNVTILDPSLSNAALGALVRILARKDTDPINEEAIAPICADGKDARTRAFSELEQRGYLHRARHRDARGKWTTTTHAHERTAQPAPQRDPVIVAVPRAKNGRWTTPAPLPADDAPSHRNGKPAMAEDARHRDGKPAMAYTCDAPRHRDGKPGPNYSNTLEREGEGNQTTPNGILAAPATATAPQTTMTPAPVTVNRSQPHPAPTVTASAPHLVIDTANAMIAAGVLPAIANRLAAAHPAAHIAAHVEKFTADAATNPKLGPGALVYRIENNAAPQPAPEPKNLIDQWRDAGALIATDDDDQPDDAGALVSTETISAASSTAASAPEPAHLVSAASSTPAPGLQNAPARHEDAQTTVYAPTHSEAPQNATTPAQPAQETQPDADPARLARTLDQLRRELRLAGSLAADYLETATLHDAGAHWLIVGASNVDYLKTPKGAIVGKKLATLTGAPRPIQYAAA